MNNTLSEAEIDVHLNLLELAGHPVPLSKAGRAVWVSRNMHRESPTQKEVCAAFDNQDVELIAEWRYHWSRYPGGTVTAEMWDLHYLVTYRSQIVQIASVLDVSSYYFEFAQRSVEFVSEEFKGLRTLEPVPEFGATYVAYNEDGTRSSKLQIKIQRERDGEQQLIEFRLDLVIDESCVVTAHGKRHSLLMCEFEASVPSLVSRAHDLARKAFAMLD